MNLPKDCVMLSRAEFNSICDQLTNLELEVTGVWAGRHDEADGLERILVPLHAARRNLETAVEIEMKSAGSARDNCKGGELSEDEFAERVEAIQWRLSVASEWALRLEKAGNGEEAEAAK